jgi:gas vesicle protein
MNIEREGVGMVVHDNGRRGHPLALGLLTGAAVGIGLGMLLAPRKGSELRHQLATQCNHLAGATSKSYRRAKDTAGHYAHRSQGAYNTARVKIAQGAQETRRYVREVTDALTMKARRQANTAAQVTSPVRSTATASHARRDALTTMTRPDAV